jgi:sterol 24-C-methyltransferase
MRRSRGTTADTLAEYQGLFDDAAGGDVAARKARYATLANDFYDLVTDFYRFGWGNSFHFAPRKRGESFAASIARSERALSDVLGLRPGMRVMDVGCGVGGPMCRIARYSGAHIIGVNINDYQVGLAKKLIARSGLAARCDAVKADFMNLPASLTGFDAAYAVEATVHAPDKAGVFREIFKILKPGGHVAGLEWCLTERYDARDPDHRRLKGDIEAGNGLPELATFTDVIDGLRAAGFEVLRAHDAAADSDPDTPWYRALEGRDLTVRSLPRTPVGRALTNVALRALESLRIAPKGTSQVSAFLNHVADDLVEAGRRGLFTPMFVFHARRNG